jgi:hypothetical protein
VDNRQIRCKQDCLNAFPSGKEQVWLSVAEPRSKRVIVDSPARFVAKRLATTLADASWKRPMRTGTLAPGKGAADAFGQDQEWGIGGWFSWQENEPIDVTAIHWFSIKGRLSDLPETHRKEGATAPQIIGSLETFAQIALLQMRQDVQGLQGHYAHVEQWSDSTTAEGATNKVFATKEPL